MRHFIVAIILLITSSLALAQNDARYQIQNTILPTPFTDHSSYDNGFFEIVTQGETFAQPNAQAIATMNLNNYTGTEVHTGNFRASVKYWVVVWQTGPSPTSTVPVRLHSQGQVDLSGPGTGNANIWLDTSFGINEGASAALGGSGLPHNTLNVSTTAQLESGAYHFISIAAEGKLNSFSQGIRDFQAVIDPYIDIDPSFPYASSFEIALSAGVGNTPLPEPAMLTPICMLYFLNRRRLRVRS
jgi:hypothetical protein